MESKHQTEMIGKKYGRLTVLSFSRIEFRQNKDRLRKRYKFQCTCECGSTVEVDGVPLRNGDTQSCGCFRKEQVKLGHEKQRGKPRPHMQKANGISISHTVFLAYKRGAERRKHDFNISESQFEKLTSQNCYYCDSEPRIVRKYDCFTERPMNGVDRIESNIGYEEANCVSCCKICNYMKQELSIEEWFSHMRKVLHFHEEGSRA